MQVMLSKRYVLGEFSVDPDKRLLYKNGERVRLSSLPFQVLLHLLDNPGKLVSRTDLLDRFWDGKDVYEDTLRKAIGAVRKALDDRTENPRFIETRWASGYIYIGPLAEEVVKETPRGALEIERVSGVKVVVEEEIHDSQPQPETAAVTAISGSRWHGLQPNIRWRTLALAGIGVILSLFVGAILSKHFGNRPPADAPPAGSRSLAVLPLENLTGDPENDYLSDGISESLINSLAKIDGLKVVSRTSAFSFKGKTVDTPEVASRLRVGAILEGSLRKSRERLRVEVRLVSAEDGRVMWASDTYDRPLGDIFLMQDEISCRVTTSLQALLCGAGGRPRHDTDNAAAYQAYLRGRYYLNKRTGEDIKKAITCFEQAIALDARYALAYAGLSECYAMGLWFVPFEPKEAEAKSKAAAEQALALDGTLAEAHAAMASVYFYEWDWPKAGQESERAIQLNPGSALLHHNYSLYLNVMKRPDEAILESARARELDPLSLSINTDLGMAYQYARGYDRAIELYHESLDLDPSFEMAHYYLGEAYMMKGAYAQALAEFQKTTERSHGKPFHLTELGLAYAYAGQTAEARQALDQLNKLSQQEYVSPYYLAEFYAALGEKEKAFYWLEQCYEEHTPNLVDLLIDPALDPLRADVRFADLVRRVGLSI